MATKRPVRIGNVDAQRQRLLDADLQRRRSASTILSPEAVAGDTSAAKVLFTTLDGQARPITAGDLARFKARIAEVGTRLREGITLEEMIDLSLPEDRDRANREIAYAAPSYIRGGLVRFVTPAGPDSKATRHITAIEFVDWASAISRPGTPLQAAAWLCREGSVRADCDCSRWTYWYRYLATVGNFVLSRRESGFPKIRNPKLAGIACKHLLRTAVSTRSDLMIRSRIAAAIETERKLLDQQSRRTTAPTIRFSQQDADRIAGARVRRITVLKRNVPTPKPPSDDAIRRAMAQLKERPDGGVLLAALESMLRQQPGAR